MDNYTKSDSAKNEIIEIVNEFNSEFNLIYSKEIIQFEPENNADLITRFLLKYHLSPTQQNWNSIYYKVFSENRINYPEWMFSSGFHALPMLGGVLFTSEELEKIRTLTSLLGESRFFVRHWYQLTDEICSINLAFPASLTWKELMSGGSYSSALIEMPRGSFSVFGESGKWGKISMNDLEVPLELWGYSPQIRTDFESIFQLDTDDVETLQRTLPAVYRSWLQKR
jgi:hypothetical protein